MKALGIIGNRQTGKTTALVGSIVLAVMKPHTRVSIFAPTISELNGIRKRITEVITHDQIAATSMLNMTLTNGSEIGFYSGSPHNSSNIGQGFGADLIAVDNMDYIDEDKRSGITTYATRMVYTAERDMFVN